MKEFVSHINYLIQKHDCVIIPDFGGFVLSHEGASFAPDGSVLPPKVTVGFNPDLKYNDGLLAESYMNMYSVTYDVACKKIEEAVKRLNTILGMKHPVQIGRLGKLSLDKSNRLSFTPNTNLSIFHPETFGLSALNIKRLSDIGKETVKTKRKVMFRRVLAGAGASAAAILLFFIASTPVSENVDMRKSSFFTDLLTTSPSETKAELPTPSTVPTVIVEEAASVANVITPENTEIAKPLEVAKPIETEPKESASTIDNEMNATASAQSYFVIIGSGGSNSEAQNLLKKFKNQGFSNVNTVASSSRVRIYVEAFSSRHEAEKYLKVFKNDNPQFNDAWVYFKN